MTSKSSEDKYRAPALDKGLDILELLASQPKGLTRGEIVKLLDRSASEIYRMLERLVIRGYVNRSLEGDRYALSIKLFQLASAFPPVRRLVDQVQPRLDLFSRASQQPIHMVMPNHGRLCVVAQAASDQALWEFRLRLGAELGLLNSGSGLTYLACSSDAHRAHLLELNGKDSTSITQDLEAELENIRITGHRMKPSQHLAGVTDISLPVFLGQESPIAILTCPFLPRFDMPDQSGEECLAIMQSTVGAIAGRD